MSGIVWQQWTVLAVYVLAVYVLAELLDSLIDTIRRLNSDPQRDRTLLFPRVGDVVVDRDRRQITARCMWKIKADYQMKES